jgi:hypothetical protein
MTTSQPATDAVTKTTTDIGDVITPATGTGQAHQSLMRLWAQIHALRAMADFLDRLNLPGLSIVFDPDRITVQVGADLGEPGQRAELVHTLAHAIGTTTRHQGSHDGRRTWVTADGDLAGHPIHIFTAIKETP